jgi:hypothetical protein
LRYVPNTATLFWHASIVELAISTIANGVQILVRLDRAPLGRLHRARASIAEPKIAAPLASTGWCQASVTTIESRVAAIPWLPIVRPGVAVVVETGTTSSHGATLMPVVVTKSRIPIASRDRRIEHRWHIEAGRHVAGTYVEGHL